MALEVYVWLLLKISYISSHSHPQFLCFVLLLLTQFHRWRPTRIFQSSFSMIFFLSLHCFSYSLTQMTLLTSPSFSCRFAHTHQYLPCRHTQQFKTCPMPYSAETSPVNALQTIFPVKNLQQCESERGGSNCAFVTSEFAVFPLNFRLIRLFSHT